MVRHEPSKNSRAYAILGGEPLTEITFRLPGLRWEHVTVGKRQVLSLTCLTPVNETTTRITQIVWSDHPAFVLLQAVHRRRRARLPAPGRRHGEPAEPGPEVRPVAAVDRRRRPPGQVVPAAEARMDRQPPRGPRLRQPGRGRRPCAGAARPAPNAPSVASRQLPRKRWSIYGPDPPPRSGGGGSRSETEGAFSAAFGAEPKRTHWTFAVRRALSQSVDRRLAYLSRLLWGLVARPHRCSGLVALRVTSCAPTPRPAPTRPPQAAAPPPPRHFARLPRRRLGARRRRQRQLAAGPALGAVRPRRDGWGIYAPLIAREIGTACPPQPRLRRGPGRLAAAPGPAARRRDRASRPSRG